MWSGGEGEGEGEWRGRGSGGEGEGEGGMWKVDSAAHTLVRHYAVWQHQGVGSESVAASLGSAETRTYTQQYITSTARPKSH